MLKQVRHDKDEMNIVFFGNTKYSAIVEESLYKNFGLSLVVTLPDRPTGRKKILTPNPVKQFAIDNNIPVIEAEKLDKTVIEKIQKTINNCHPELTPCHPEFISGSEIPKQDGYQTVTRQVRNDKEKKPDFLVVADYGLILPKELLGLPKYAPLNVHHSLLPKYRGPSPAPTAILNGDKISGVTVIRMSEQLDAGEILGQKEYELKKDETTDSLLTRLNEIGAELISSIVRTIELNKKVDEKIQDESKASYTKKINKIDGYIDLENPPAKDKLDRMIRAYFPWPTVWTLLRQGSGGQGKKIRIKFLPGNKIQVEGKNPMSYKDFVNGYPEGKEILSKILYTNISELQ